jgi:hypothetical protein
MPLVADVARSPPAPGRRSVTFILAPPRRTPSSHPLVAPPRRTLSEDAHNARVNHVVGGVAKSGLEATINASGLKLVERRTAQRLRLRFRIGAFGAGQSLHSLLIVVAGLLSAVGLATRCPGVGGGAPEPRVPTCPGGRESAPLAALQRKPRGKREKKREQCLGANAVVNQSNDHRGARADPTKELTL